MTGTVERAFELAPNCRSIEELRLKLLKEGHSNVDAHLRAGVLRKDLLKLLQR